MALVDDSELRISLAQKHQCHDIVINVRLGAKASQSELWAGCVEVADCFIGQSDVPGPERPPAVDKIPRKGGERLSRGEDD